MTEFGRGNFEAFGTLVEAGLGLGWTGREQRLQWCLGYFDLVNFVKKSGPIGVDLYAFGSNIPDTVHCLSRGDLLLASGTRLKRSHCCSHFHPLQSGTCTGS